MELNADIVGTNPKYPKIVNQQWLDVDVKSYDNFPSDNNPVRVVPKLSDIWNHEGGTGATLVPNAVIMPLGKSADDEKKSSDDTVTSIIREAKKAMMAGLKGKGISEHLRSLFTAKHIEAAKEPLSKLAEEQGLLGNVYIDASAFSSLRDAEQFLSQHRNRLAQDIVVNGGALSHSVVSALASKFRKNVIAKVNYDAKTFDKYKNHLVTAGKIDSNFTIDSKEALRLAFIYEKPVVVPEVQKKEAKKLSESEVSEGLSQIFQSKEESNRLAHDQLLIPTIRPVLEYAQEQLASGKEASAVKDMLRAKFVKEDLTASIQGLAIMASENGLTAENIDSYVTSGKITEIIGSELKRIGKKFPVRAKTAPDYERSERSIGVKAYFYALEGKSVSGDENLTSLKTASVSALRKGFAPEKVLAKLQEKLTEVEANNVMAMAIKELNETPAGAKANLKAKVQKEAFPETNKMKNFGLMASDLPDPSTVNAENQELMNFYEGSGSMDVDVTVPEKQASLEIKGIFNRNGIDSAL